MSWNNKNILLITNKTIINLLNNVYNTEKRGKFAINNCKIFGFTLLTQGHNLIHHIEYIIHLDWIGLFEVDALVYTSIHHVAEITFTTFQFITIYSCAMCMHGFYGS